MNPADALARAIADLDRRLRGVERASQADRTSVEVNGEPVLLSTAATAGIEGRAAAAEAQEAASLASQAAATAEEKAQAAQAAADTVSQEVAGIPAEIDAAMGEAVSTAASDAQAKADAAEDAAIQAAATDAATKAATAKSEAIAAAAITAQQKADEAEQAAIDAAALTAQAKADTAKAEALSAAAVTAQEKADAAAAAAKAAAVSEAASTAQAKADAARDAAIAASVSKVESAAGATVYRPGTKAYFPGTSTSIADYLVLQTTLPATSGLMLRLKFTGSTLASGNIEGWVSVYLYNTSGGTLYLPKISTYGELPLVGYMAKNASGNLAVILTPAPGAPAWDYLRFSVDEVQIGNGTLTAAMQTGWTVSLAADTSAYASTIVPCVARDLQDTHTLAQGWRKAGTVQMDGGKLYADSVTTTSLGALAVTAAKIATDAVEAAKIKAGAVIAEKIATDAILARHIKAAEILATHIKAGTLTSASGVFGDVSAATISSGFLAAARIATGTIITEHLAAGAVIAEKIATGAITAEKIAVDALDGRLITGTTLRTAASGARWVIGNTGFQNVLQAFSTDPAEIEPAEIRADNETGDLIIEGRRTTAIGNPVQVQVAERDFAVYSDQSVSLMAADNMVLSSGDARLDLSASGNTGGSTTYGVRLDSDREVLADSHTRVTMHAHTTGNVGAKVIATPGAVTLTVPANGTTETGYQTVEVDGNGTTITGPIKASAMGSMQNSPDGLGSTSAVMSERTGGALVFVAPPSGRVWVTVGGFVRATVQGQVAYASYRLRTGGTVGAGSLIQDQTSGRAFGNYNVGFVGGSWRGLVDGLTPGATYNLVPVFAATGANGGYFSGVTYVVEPSL